MWAYKRKILWTGVESSKRAISLGNKAFHCNIDLGNAEDLPYPTDSFDCVVCLGSLEHISNPHKALREIYRVCKPDGRIVILVPNRIPIFDWIFFDYGTEQEYEVKRTKKEWLKLFYLNLIRVHRIRRDFGPSLFKNFKPVAFIKRLLLKLTRILPHYFTYCWIFDCTPLGSKAHRGKIPLQKWDVYGKLDNNYNKEN
jgi:SAM-dependent methyltransferase